MTRPAPTADPTDVEQEVLATAATSGAYRGHGGDGPSPERGSTR